MDHQTRYGIIYKATCQVDGKIYIGQTTDLNERMRIHERRGRYVDHHTHFYNAIAKHGWKTFTWEAIDSANSAADLDEREIHWIKILRSDQREYGYNILPGGKGRRHGPETRAKISQSNKRAIAEGRKARDFPPLTQEHLDKRAETMKEGYASGRIIHWTKGKSRTDEDRTALSKAAAKHPVRCIETGIEYESVKAAAIAINGSPHKIARAAKGIQKTAAGYRWCYINSESNAIIKGPIHTEENRKLMGDRSRGKSPTNARKVLCIETGEIFASLAAAGRSVNRTSSAILNAIKRSGTSVYHWCYL